MYILNFSGKIAKKLVSPILLCISASKEIQELHFLCLRSVFRLIVNPINLDQLWYNYSATQDMQLPTSKTTSYLARLQHYCS